MKEIKDPPKTGSPTTAEKIEALRRAIFALDRATEIAEAADKRRKNESL